MSGSSEAEKTPSTAELVDLYEMCLSLYESEHKMHLELWKIVETKAHSLATVSGIFIAAIVALASRFSNTPPCFRGLALAVLSSLLITMMAAMVVLFVEPRLQPPGGAEMAEMLEDLEKSEAIGDTDRRLRLQKDVEIRWRETSTRFAASLERKATALMIGQLFLVLSTILAIFTAMSVVYKM